MECEITLSEIDQIQHRRFSTDLMTRKDRLWKKKLETNTRLHLSWIVEELHYNEANVSVSSTVCLKFNANYNGKFLYIEPLTANGRNQLEVLHPWKVKYR